MIDLTDSFPEVARKDDFLKNRNIFSYCYICKVQFFLICLLGSLGLIFLILGLRIFLKILRSEEGKK